MAQRKKIIDLVLQKQDEFNQNVGTADQNKDAAIAAIIGGINSPEWETYMGQFVDNNDAEQLMRLKATDGTDADASLREHRAYLLTNAVCGETTKGRFADNVQSIDRDLETDCAPTPKP